MEFAKIEEWGFVEPDTHVQNSEGTQYVVMKQNDAGFLALKNVSGGEHLAFEALDRIDHNEFCEAN